MTEESVCVLHADPADAFAASLEDVLRRASGRFDVDHVTGMAAALDAFDPARYDCVVVERDLGDGTGLDVLERVRTTDSDLPVLVVTGGGDEAFAAAALDAGVTGYHRKADSETLERLPNRIRRSVAVSRADRLAAGRTRELTTLHAVCGALIRDAPLADRLREVATALARESNGPDPLPVRIVVDGVVFENLAGEGLGDDAFETVTEAPAGDVTVRIEVGSDGAGADTDHTADSDTDHTADSDGFWPSVARLVGVHVERAETVDRLRAFAERLDTILEHTTNVVFMKDLEDRYLLVNEAFASMVGRDRDAILGRTTAAVHGEAVADRFRDHDAAAIEAGEPKQFEERYPTPDGDRRFVTVRVPLFDGDGDPYAVYGIATDVTTELRLADERADLLDRIADGFIAIDEDDEITFLNARAVAFAGEGRDRESLVGRGFWEAFPEADTALAEAIREARERGEATTATAYYEPVDGHFEARVYPEGESVSMYVRDVTDRVREREELQRRERVMKRLYEIIAEKDTGLESKVTQLLGLGKEVLGVESGLLSHIEGEQYRAEVVDDDTGVFVADDVVPLSVTICERVVSQAGSIQVCDARTDPELADRDGVSGAGIACYVGAPVVVDDETYGTFCFYDREDRPDPFPEWEVTLVDMMARWVSYELERREAQSAVTRERDRLDRFASMVSHDLRNPLNVASGNLELARETGDTDRLDTAANALDRMDELIDDALSFARLGERVVDTERVDLATVAREAWNTVETGDATLVVEEPGVALGDASRVRTLFENLFRNSVEHGSTSSRAEPDDSVEHGGDAVTVTVGREGTTLFVADDGPGIPEADREQVFETGFTTDSEGTGFGLGIVEGIATAHGWSVAATESADGGARIEVRGVTPLRDDE